MLDRIGCIAVATRTTLLAVSLAALAVSVHAAEY